MGNSSGVAVFIFQALLALFAFFVTAPMMLNTISLFGVQKRFAQEMIQLGVVKESDVKNMQPKKQIVGIVIALVVFGALCYSCYRTAPMGYICGGVPLLAGIWKYRNILEMNNLTVKRFKNTYKDCMNTKKYNEYVRTHF
jgi:hypothetical protein